MKYIEYQPKRVAAVLLAALAAVVVVLGVAPRAAAQVQNPQSGSTGLQGKISAPPPATGATISLPSNGQTFETLPITVSGICPEGLLVKLFKNNVFAGSAQCDGGSFSIPIDLFNGTNELVARVYDALDQAGPDSNVVSVTFNDNISVALNRVSITSNYAKRGANVGSNLEWPIILAGGTGPYAVSVDWGDGSPVDLISQEFPGILKLNHSYDSPGVYNIIVKVTDVNGATAYLQLVGVGNGPLSQENVAGKDGQGGSGGSDGSSVANTITKTRIIWEPLIILIPFIVLTFWLGKRHQMKVLRRRIEQGQRPF
ncbi:hypothetical protein CR970_03315 [Candidatus Saccharibacteria bacterium]|nr:MAG: hypothetical protein CR970_03315 [Candidatus Saccharibacteria bacterium]